MEQIATAGKTADAMGPLAQAVTAELTFITPTGTGTKPTFESAAYTGGAPRIFFETERHAVRIANMRRLTDPPSLAREGFVLRRHTSTVTDFYDDAQLKDVYYKEIQALVGAACGATRVFVFDTTRRSDGGAGAPNHSRMRGPAGRVHVDYTTKSGPQRSRDVLGAAETERLLIRGARIVQVNVWRPIRGPVRRSPLALADASSVRAVDLIATDQVFPDRVGEIYHLVYHPGQRWYYAPRMTVDEVILIKGWDSLDDGRARFTPHGAFALPGTADDTPARESIEVRTFAVIEPARSS